MWRNTLSLVRAPRSSGSWIGHESAWPHSGCRVAQAAGDASAAAIAFRAMGECGSRKSRPPDILLHDWNLPMACAQFLVGCASPFEGEAGNRSCRAAICEARLLSEQIT